MQIAVLLEGNVRPLLKTNTKAEAEYTSATGEVSGRVEGPALQMKRTMKIAVLLEGNVRPLLKTNTKGRSCVQLSDGRSERPSRRTGAPDEADDEDRRVA